jgi:alpha-glucosidase (family GH31 glycosyl hydrolase)
MVYMRSQLSFIEIYGGILLRPVFTEFPGWTQAESPSTVLFGEDILVLLNFEQDSWTRTLYSFPPEHDWVDLNNFETYRGGENGPYTIDTTNKVAMFQKSGSIVPLQNVSSIAEVTQKELILSIALNNSRATGYIFLEEGP